MSLGTGIFLSAVFLGVIALYLGTKDRWNWRKITVFVILVPTILVGGILGWMYWESRPAPPAPVFEFWDIRLGATKDDVLFIKGEPTNANEAETSLDWYNSLIWTYDVDEPNHRHKYSVLFLGDEKTVQGVVYTFGGGSDYWSPELLGVKAGTTTEELLSRLGEPDEIEAHGVMRFYHYHRFNVRYAFQQNAVYNMGISSTGQ